jgi:hypothetical protein
MVVRCRHCQTFRKEWRWRNPQYRDRIRYPDCYYGEGRDGWLNQETRELYSEFIKDGLRERMVTEAEPEPGGSSRLRELVERGFGVGVPWTKGGLNDRLLKRWLDKIDWDEICVALRLLSGSSRAESSTAAG